MPVLDHTRAGFKQDVDEFHDWLSSLLAAWGIQISRVLESVLLLPFVFLFTILLRVIEVVVTCYYYLLAFVTFEVARIPTVSVDGIKRGVREKSSETVVAVEKRVAAAMARIKAIFLLAGEKSLNTLSLLFAPIIIALQTLLRVGEAMVTAALVMISFGVVGCESASALLFTQYQNTKLYFLGSLSCLKGYLQSSHDASKTVIIKFVCDPAFAWYQHLVLLFNGIRQVCRLCARDNAQHFSSNPLLYLLFIYRVSD